MPFAPDKAPSFDLPPLGSVPPLPSLEALPAHDALGAAFAAPSDEPQAQPVAARAPGMTTLAGKTSNEQQAMRAGVTVLKEVATQGVVEPAQSSMKSAASVLVAMLGASVDAASNKKKKRGTKASSAGTVAAVQPAQEPEEPPSRDSGIERRDLRAPEAALDDAVLSQVADALRNYPEIEWACEVSDGGEAQVIGMRIASTFLTRVPEIKTAVAKVGKAHGAALVVLVLDDPQQMREARTQGNLFFPWRKRAAAKP